MFRTSSGNFRLSIEMTTPNPNKTPGANANADAGTGPWIEIVRKHVDSMRHGAVEIVIHDGRVVEIKRSERVRLGIFDQFYQKAK